MLDTSKFDVGVKEYYNKLSRQAQTDIPMQQQVGANKRFDSGAERSPDADRYRFDLLCPEAMGRLAATMAEGARKYGEGNWQKGVPITDCLNHCLRHINMYIGGDRSEDHLAHAMANLMMAIHVETGGCGCGYYPAAAASDFNRYLMSRQVTEGSTPATR